jgi:hypothetical protein
MTKITIGAAISVIGWVVLLGFSGTGSSYGREVINFHMVAIANNITLLGYAVVLWGAIEQASNLIADRIGGTSIAGSAPAPYSEGSSNSVDTPLNTSSDMSMEDLAARKQKLEASLSKMKS